MDLKRSENKAQPASFHGNSLSLRFNLPTNHPGSSILVFPGNAVSNHKHANLINGRLYPWTYIIQS